MVHKAFNLMNKIEATLNSAKDLTPAPKPSNRKSLSDFTKKASEIPKKSLSDSKIESQSFKDTKRSNGSKPQRPKDPKTQRPKDPK
jgi:hypothetical protein